MRSIHDIKRVIRNQNERARKNGKPHTLTIDEWLAILDCFDGKCAYCKTAPWEVLDHLIPIKGRKLKNEQHIYMSGVSNGLRSPAYELGDGGTTKSNCIPACRACNSQKSNKHPFSGLLNSGQPQKHPPMSRERYFEIIHLIA